MDKVNKLFLQALKASLCDQKVDWNFVVQPQEWMCLFHQAEIHHVLPMIYEAVYGCPAARKLEVSFFSPFKKKTVQQVMMQTIRTGEFLQLYQYLRETGISPIVVKGIICRELYPNPDHRSSGDEDILIRPETFDICHSMLLEYGMIAADAKQDIQKVYEVPYGKKDSPIYIELHKYLFPPDSEAYGEFNRFFENVHGQATDIMIQGVPISTMDHTSHLFYLICHAFKHFLHSGFGIRQICDIVLFANRYGNEIRWKNVLEQCKVIHAEQFAAALFRIGEKYLTFHPTMACYPLEWSSIEVDETLLLKDLLAGGIYGDASMNRKHSSNITLNAVSAQKSGKRRGGSILRTAFPTLKDMERRYPYLKKYPCLLPAAWTDRMIKYKKEVNQTKDSGAVGTIQIGNDRLKLMKQYGIVK